MTFSAHRHHFDMYQQMLVSYDVGSKSCDPKFVHMLGLAGEVGEVLEPLKKHFRDGTPLNLRELESELGDVLYYVNVLADDYGLRMSNVTDGTLIKLAHRRRLNVAAGRTDKR